MSNFLKNNPDKTLKIEVVEVEPKFKFFLPEHIKNLETIIVNTKNGTGPQGESARMFAAIKAETGIDYDDIYAYGPPTNQDVIEFKSLLKKVKHVIISAPLGVSEEMLETNGISVGEFKKANPNEGHLNSDPTYLFFSHLNKLSWIEEAKKYLISQGYTVLKEPILPGDTKKPFLYVLLDRHQS